MEEAAAEHLPCVNPGLQPDHADCRPGRCQRDRRRQRLDPYDGWTNFNDVSLGSAHGEGTNFVNGDGSVRYVRSSVALGPFLATAGRNDGEVNVATD